jgi:hypothetical protein
MVGMRFEGTTEDVEFVPNQRTVSKSKGGIENTIVGAFQPENGGTRMTLDIEYTVPVPLLGKLAEAFIVRVNEREVETLLANLKDRLEA